MALFGLSGGQVFKYITLLLFFNNIYHVESLVPSCAITFGDDNSGKVYAAQASFGASIPMQTSSSLNVNLVRPLGYQDGCKPTISSSIKNMNFALLVERSPNCTFSDRAIAAQKIGPLCIFFYILFYSYIAISIWNVILCFHYFTSLLSTLNSSFSFLIISFYTLCITYKRSVIIDSIEYSGRNL